MLKRIFEISSCAETSWTWQWLVIIGAAFNAIVTSMVKDVLTQFIAAIVAKPDFQWRRRKGAWHPHYDRQTFSTPLSRFSSWPAWSILEWSCPSTTSCPESRSPRRRHTKPCPECLSEITHRRPPLRPTAPSR